MGKVKAVPRLRRLLTVGSPDKAIKEVITKGTWVTGTREEDRACRAISQVAI
jgi:hypothetical protein